MTIDDIDLVEINEAFAVQVIACARDLGHRPGEAERARRRDRARPSVRDDRRADHGDAAERAAERDGRFGLETMCVGGGQGMAMVVERLS